MPAPRSLRLSPTKKLVSKIKAEVMEADMTSTSKSRKRRHISISYETKPESPATKEEELKGKDKDFNETDKWEPKNWKLLYKNILEMRKQRDAPVDTMGCERVADVKESPKVFRYQTLLSLMLSSQTKDEVTSAAMSRLQQHGCNIDSILDTPDNILGSLIKPVGFWKRKVEYIKKTSQILKDTYDNDIPDSVEGLCQLPGIGPKMAYLTMTCAWGKCVGIGVDVHVHRISNRLGWVRKLTEQPEQTRKELESWLPREYWEEVNYIFVGFGQQICKAVNPMCSTCLNKSICPYGVQELRKSQKKKKAR